MPILGPPTALSPKDWGAKVDYDQWADLYTPDDGVVLHHGGSGNYPAAQPPYTVDREAEQLRAWERYHLSKGWRGLAYGWGVGQSGTIYRIRGWNTYGAHLGDIDGDGSDNNHELIPIIWIASGNHHQVSAAAGMSIDYLRGWMLESAPKARRLWGHQEVQPKSTSCPGPGGMAYVTAHRDPSQQEDDMTPAQAKQLEDIWRVIGISHRDKDGRPILTGTQTAQYPDGSNLAHYLRAVMTPKLDKILKAVTTGSDHDLSAIAKAVADEQARRLAS